MGGLLNRKRLGANDDYETARNKISERIPGVQVAIVEMGEVLKKRQEDPMRTLKQLDKAKVYGMDLWTLYKVVCEGDASRVVGVMEKWKDGHVSDKQLHRAIREEIVGLTNEPRIQPGDDDTEARWKISDGLLGVQGVLVEMSLASEKRGAPAMDILHKLDKAKLYGNDVFVLYKTVCEKDPVKAVEIIEKWSEGSISDKQLHHAVNNQGEGLVDVASTRELKKPTPGAQKQTATSVSKRLAGVGA